MHSTFILRYFPLWALLLSACALYVPEPFIKLKTGIIPLLMVIMLGMGLTLSWQDFSRVLQKKRIISLGVGIQYLVMPLAALFLSRVLELSTELTIGMMLVGATAGGTASNVIAYLAKGDVALSVSMTLVSTLLATVLLPGLTWFYLGERVNVPVVDMLWNLLKLIIFPVLLGVWINSRFHKSLSRVLHWFPLFSVLAIVLIIAIIVALNQKNLATVGFSLMLAVILHNTIGLACGYGICKLLGYDGKTARTVAIESGMQNSGLSVALALKFFTPASALPGALFSIWHNISGAFLAAYWQKRQENKGQK